MGECLFADTYVAFDTGSLLMFLSKYSESCLECQLFLRKYWFMDLHSE